jgi:hypothetical protein
VKSARDQFAGDPQGFANWQHKNAAWGGDDPHKFYPGDPEPTSAQRAAADKLPLENALRMHGVKPGPLNKIGGTPGDAGYYNGKTVTPPATPGAPTGKTAGKTQAPATNDQLGKWFGTMKPGSTMNIQGKTYFKNMNGAVVDKTNPAAAKRITDRAGAFIGQAAAPPPPGAPATAQAAIAPTAAPAAAPAAGGVDPQQFADMQQQFQQMQQQLQQYQQGGGGYGNAQMTGNEMGYGGMPQQFSGFGNAIMQGMGGGYGNSLMQMPSDYAMAQGMGGMGGGGYGDPYGGMGGYGMPQQFSQGMMGGYGGDIGDPYGMGNQMIQGAMGGYGQGMDQMMGYNAGMGGYGAPGMGYY